MLKNVLFMCCVFVTHLNCSYQSPCLTDPNYRAVKNAKIHLYREWGNTVDKQAAVNTLAVRLEFYPQQVAEILGSQQIDAHYRLAANVRSAPPKLKGDPEHQFGALIDYAARNNYIDDDQREMLIIHHLFGNAAKHYLDNWGSGAQLSRAIASQRSRASGHRLRHAWSSDSD